METLINKVLWKKVLRNFPCLKKLLIEKFALINLYQEINLTKKVGKKYIYSMWYYLMKKLDTFEGWQTGDKTINVED